MRRYVTTGRNILLKSAHFRGGSGPHLIHSSLDLYESAPKWHLDRFGRFCTVHLCDKHRDTDEATCDICSMH